MIYSYLFETKLKAVSRRNVLIKTLFLDDKKNTSIQLRIEDFPTYATPTSASFTLSSVMLESDRSLSVYIE